MRIVLGLGNPGPEYASHRHNIGFRCVDRLAARLGIRLKRVDRNVRQAVGQMAGVPVVVACATTFMNASGRAAGRLLEWHGGSVEDLIVAHDEVDLDMGTVKVKDGGGHGGHNGLRSIIEQLGERQFVRVRIGVGRPTSSRVELADWVLSDFHADERTLAGEMAERGADAVESIVTGGAGEAMNRFNSSSAG